ncbi:MAG: ATP-binding protein [Nannocystaceae bacterium]|nr:ATP-binding protein [bacterium]
MKLDAARLLTFSAKLQSAGDVGDLLNLTAEEVGEALGYRTVWIAVFDFEHDAVRMLAIDGDKDADVWEHAPVFPLSADPYMLRIASSTEPAIVRDAQTDPDVNREVVETLGNRTIVNVPMWLVDQPFGALGMGTFGDEGVLVPTPEQLTYLQSMATHLVAASARIVLMRQRADAAAETARIERLLEQRGRLASLGQLAGGVAHDFNNLLTVIMASTEFLLEGETDESRGDELRIVRDAADRAAELTRRLLALGQRQVLRLGEVELDEMLSSLVEMVRRVTPSNVQIVLQATEPLTLVADRSQLEQVITNLCLNARDAMPEGGTLTIGSQEILLDRDALSDWPGVEPGRFVEITVSDTGTGIPPEVREHLFEPFFTTKESDRGTGLGLAICRGIVQRHGGVIRLETELGEGTTFRAAIPTRTATSTAIDRSSSTSFRGDERILVADDQPHVRRAMRRTLEQQGYQVTSVPDGQAAVDAASDQTFDLVILDAMMPKLGGRKAYDAIRTVCPRTRFLFASGYGAEEVTTRFLADTNVEFLAKPFAPPMLLATVRAVLDCPAEGA